MVSRGPFPSRLNPDVLLRLWILLLVVIVLLFLIGSAISLRRYPYGRHHARRLSKLTDLFRSRNPNTERLFQGIGHSWHTDSMGYPISSKSHADRPKRSDLFPPRDLDVNQLDAYTECIDWSGKDNESYLVYLAGRQDMQDPQILTPTPRENRFCIDTSGSPLLDRWLAVSTVDAKGNEGVLSKAVRVKFPG